MAVQYCPRAIYSVKTVIRTFNAVDGRPLAAAGLLAICLFMLATESKNKKKIKMRPKSAFCALHAISIALTRR